MIQFITHNLNMMIEGEMPEYSTHKIQWITLSLELNKRGGLKKPEEWYSVS